MKPLSTEGLRAVSLLAGGASEQETAEQLGKSRSWVQSLKRRDDFQLALTNARLLGDNTVKEAFQEFQALTKEEYMQELRKFGRVHYDEGYRYINLGKKILTICEKRMADLDPDNLSIQGLCGLLKATQLTMKFGTDLLNDSLLVEKVCRHVLEDMAEEDSE